VRAGDPEHVALLAETEASVAQMNAAVTQKDVLERIATAMERLADHFAPVEVVAIPQRRRRRRKA